MKEIWKDIKGFEGKYQISNIGRVKSLKRKGRLSEIIMKQSKLNYTYLGVYLRSKYNEKNKVIHRLVCEAFIPNPENKPQINHKDGNKLNNCVENLEWCTHSENIKHAYKNNQTQGRRGKAGIKTRLNAEQVNVIRNCTDLTNRELAEIFNVNWWTVSKIKNYKSYQSVI